MDKKDVRFAKVLVHNIFPKIFKGAPKIKIGWRKRVIEIDWKDSLNKEYSADLFPDEEVTKYDHYIHAWSIEDAKRYIEKVLTTAS